MRRERDKYYTPRWLANAIVGRLVRDRILCPGLTVWEPHAGDGAFVETLVHYGFWVHATDIEPGASFVEQRDALMGPPDWFKPDYIVGNPPYSDAEAHIWSFLDFMEGRPVVMLLRLGFLAGKGRRAFWENNPLRGLYTIAKRPSFTGEGTDFYDYGVFVWGNGPQFIGRIEDDVAR